MRRLRYFGAKASAVKERGCRSHRWGDRKAVQIAPDVATAEVALDINRMYLPMTIYVGLIFVSPFEMYGPFRNSTGRSNRPDLLDRWPMGRESLTTQSVSV